MTRADKILTAGVIVLVLVAFFFNSKVFSTGSKDGATAVIKVQGKVVMTVDLYQGENKDTFTLEGKHYPETVEVENGSIRIIESPCPDQICVKRGWIDTPGESIICVPNEIVIDIESGKNSIDEIDVIAQ